MLIYFIVFLIKERVSKFKYFMFLFYCIMNRKVCIKCKKLLNERGIIFRNYINLNFFVIMYIYVLIIIKIYEILFNSQRGVVLKIVLVVYLNMVKFWSLKRVKIFFKMKD